jgi:hypothetical protein
VPDHQTLLGPILDQEAGKVEDKLKLKLKGQKATFQTDGWKNKAKQTIVATIVSIDFEVSGNKFCITDVIKLSIHIAIFNVNS